MQRPKTSFTHHYTLVRDIGKYKKGDKAEFGFISDPGYGDRYYLKIAGDVINVPEPAMQLIVGMVGGLPLEWYMRSTSPELLQEER